MTIFWTVHCVAAALALLAALWNLRTDQIPNAICLIGLVAGAVLIVVDSNVGSHAEGFFAAFLPAIVAYRKNLAGGGATKWFSVVSWMLGLRATLIMWPVVLSAVVVALARHHFRDDAREPSEIPMAPVVFVAVLIATLVERRWS
jgi:Flp pilus assembly protein protease CpaA